MLGKSKNANSSWNRHGYAPSIMKAFKKNDAFFMIGEANRHYVCGEKYVFSLHGKLSQNASIVIHPKTKTVLCLYYVLLK